MESTYKLINMPLTLSRVVSIYDEEKSMSEWELDAQWYIDTECTYGYYLNYLASKNLLVDAEKVLGRGIREAIVTRGDLIDEGFSFFQYSCDGWLNYFDKNKDKPTFNAQKKLDSLYKKWQELVLPASTDK